MFEFVRRRARDKFARQLLDLIAASGGPTDSQYDSKQIIITVPDTVANPTNL